MFPPAPEAGGRRASRGTRGRPTLVTDAAPFAPAPVRIAQRTDAIRPRPSAGRRPRPADRSGRAANRRLAHADSHGPGRRGRTELRSSPNNRRARILLLLSHPGPHPPGPGFPVWGCSRAGRRTLCVMWNPSRQPDPAARPRSEPFRERPAAGFAPARALGSLRDGRVPWHDADQAHQFEGVAAGDDAGPQGVVEGHVAVGELVAEVHVRGPVAQLVDQAGEG